MTTRRIPRPDVSKPAPVAAGTVRRIAVTVGGVQAPGSPITTEGTIALPAYPTGAAPHAVEHQNGGTDEINVAGLSGELADPQPPKAHTHVKADITDFAHTHPQADITNLVTDLAAKQPLDTLLTTLAALADAPGFLENDGAGVLSWGTPAGGGGGSGGGATAFTPSITFATPGDLTVAYTTRTGRYVRIGDKVFVDIVLDFTPTYTTAASSFRITGLPFTIATTEPRSAGTLIMAYAFTQPTPTKQQYCIAIEGTTYLQLGASADGASGSATFTVTQFASGSNRFLRVSIAYTAVHDDAYNLALGSGREKLTANRTYYVRSDGNDSNTGLANTAGGAFLTIQKAIDVCSYDIDPGAYQLSIQVADGTYNAAVVLRNFTLGASLNITGNTTTPANVTITTTSASCFDATSVAGRWYIRGFKLSTVTAGSCININSKSSVIRYSEIDFGASAGNHVVAQGGGTLELAGNCTISGSASSGRHMAVFGSYLSVTTAVTITLTGTPAFAQFILADRLGWIILNGAMTFSGSATGQRYYVSLNSVIYTNSGSATYFPGNSAGTAVTGGQYA